MSVGLQLKAALEGSLEAELEAGAKRVTYAAQAALAARGDALKAKLRLDVSSSRLRNGSKIAKTWRTKFYRNAGPDPAVVIRSTAPLLISAFEQGVEIKSSNGGWLAIPNPALRIRVKRNASGRSIIGQYEARFGALRMVFLPGRRDLALLVTDLRQTRSGGYRKPSANGRSATKATVVFFLVPKARAPKLLRGQVLRDRARRDFPKEFQREFDRYLAEAEAGPRALTFQPSAGD